MTEQEWMVSTDPSKMYDFIKNRVTERQRRLFIEAVEFVWSNGGNNGVFSYEASRHSHEGVIECLRIHNLTEDIPKWADVLREIIGNPFCPIMFGHDGYSAYGKSNVSIILDPSLLTWNNSTIPHIVAEILDERCPRCINQPKPGRIPYPNAWDDFCDCHVCGATGHVPRTTPQWSMMPVLADALEEAGCTELAILDHLRGEEPCTHCDERWNHNETWRFAVGGRCSHCNGTGKRPVTHVKGCWVLELLRGIDIAKAVG